MVLESPHARVVGIALARMCVFGAGSVPPRLDAHEAAGNFRHVAGSACCHPQAEPWSRTPAPEVCEERCVDSITCDAYVFAPSDGSCWLVRFERGADGVPIVATRPAMDRVFGSVTRATFGSAGGFKKAEGKPKGSNKRGPGSRSSKPAEEAEECEAFNMFEGGGSGCYERSPESACGSGDFFDWSSATFEGEFCSAGSDDCPSECCTTGDPTEWARDFREARKQVWPTREACHAECSEECAADMKEARAEALHFAKNLIEKMFGKDAEIEYFFGVEDEEEEEAVFCEDICGGVCEDFDRPSWVPGPGLDAEPSCETHSTPACSETATTDQGVDIAAKVADRLRAALDRASLKIREGAPDLLDNAMPQLPGFHGRLLDDGPTGHLPFAEFGEELLWDLEGSDLLGDSGLGVNGFLTDLPGEVAWWDEPGDAWPDALDAQLLDLSGGNGPAHASVDRVLGDASGLSLASRVSSMELVPSRANFYQGLPQAAQWAAGSPPFLERLLRRASSRLGIGPTSSVEMMR